MKKYIIVTGIFSGLIFALFLSSSQITFQEDNYYEVSSEEEEYETHGSEEDWELL